MTLDVVNAQNEKVGSVDVRDDVFGGLVKTDLIWESVVRENASKRRGTHATKNRAAVAGSGKKPWKQKGTGRARSGSNTSPVWVGGGRAHGPEPHEYNIEMPKKQRRVALTSALSLKAREAKVAVLGDLSMDAPKSKTIAGMLGAMGLGGAKTLVVFGAHDENVQKSCRNLKNLRTTLAHQLNPYDLLETEAVILTAPALAKVQEVFAR